MTNYSHYEKLVTYVQSLSQNKSLLWEIELSNGRNMPGFLAQASRSYIASFLSISVHALHGRSESGKAYQKELSKIDKLLVKEMILIRDENASVLSIRKEMKIWWKSLSYEDKENLEFFGDSIRFNKYIKNWRGGLAYKLTQQLGEVFNQELRDLGILSNEYVKAKDRHKNRDKNFRQKQTDIKNEREKLGKLKLESESDLLKPTPELPFIQVKQLFAAKGCLATSESSRNNYRDGCTHFIAFLNKIGTDPLCKLKNVLSEYIFLDFRENYIDDALVNKKIAPATAITILSTIRRTLFRAKSIKQLGFKSFIDVELAVKGRITENYKPFTLSEKKQVKQAINTDIEEIKTLMSPYKKIGVGENPLNEKGHIKPGMCTEDNARYIFENIFNCEPVFYRKNNTQIEISFLKIVWKSAGKLHDVYKKWGIITQVNKNIITPFILKFAQIVGMNADPILNLQLTDFNECHPLTKRPCITYWKERSIGEIDMHLDLFDSDMHWLTTKQSRAVWDLLDIVKTLTKKIRERAPADLKNRLFIYECSGQTKFGEILSHTNRMHRAYAAFVKKHNLITENSTRLTLVLTRFRPTYVSELIEAGVSLREIQISLGHKSIQTTVNYLDQMDFNRIARLKLIDALSEIHHMLIKKKKAVNYKYIQNEENIIFQTPLSGCANIFNPPDFIRNTPSYKKGQACSQYNKCLGCEHLLIAGIHLPTLFALQKHYIHLTEKNRVLDTPYGVIILENLSLLEQILDPTESEFTEEELSYAKKISINVDLINIENMGA